MLQCIPPQVRCLSSQVTTIHPVTILSCRHETGLYKLLFWPPIIFFYEAINMKNLMADSIPPDRLQFTTTETGGSEYVVKSLGCLPSLTDNKIKLM